MTFFVVIFVTRITYCQPQVTVGTQNNKNGPNIAGNQNNYRTYKIYYTVNLIQDSLNKYTLFKGFSRSPSIIDMLNQKVQTLINKNSVFEVVNSQDSLISYLNELLPTIKNLSSSEKNIIASFISNLEKVNKLLKIDENDLRISEENKQKIIVGNVSSINLLNTTANNSISIFKFSKDLQAIYEEKVEDEMWYADSLLSTNHEKLGLRIYKDKLDSSRDNILRSYILSHQALYYIPGYSINVSYNGGDLKDMKLGESDLKARSLCLEALKLYSYNFEAYKYLILNEGQRVAEKYADSDSEPPLTEFSDALDWAQKGIALGKEKDFEPWEIKERLFDNVYVASGNYAMLLEKAQSAYDDSPEYYRYLYYVGLANCYLGNYSRAMRNLDNCFFKAVKDDLSDQDERIYDKGSYTEIILAKLLTCDILINRRFPEKTLIDNYKKNLKGVSNYSRIVAVLDRLYTKNLANVFTLAEQTSGGDKAQEFTTVLFNLFGML